MTSVRMLVRSTKKKKKDQQLGNNKPTLDFRDT